MKVLAIWRRVVEGCSIESYLRKVVNNLSFGAVIRVTKINVKSVIAADRISLTVKFHQLDFAGPV